MILSTSLLPEAALVLGVAAIVCFGISGLRSAGPVAATRWFSGAVVLHAGMLVLAIGSLGLERAQARLGFGPVLSLTVCLALAVHAWQGSFVAVDSVRRWLSLAGAAAVAIGALFPGEARSLGGPWGPVHWLLGVAAYGLFGAAVFHALLLDAADRRLRLRKSAAASAPVPLLHIERITFGYVKAGFVVLTAAIALGAATRQGWKWDHKTVLSLLAWAIFALLLAGRQWRGWRGTQATRWLYAGDLVLLLAYVGSRFVTEVVLQRPPA